MDHNEYFEEKYGPIECGSYCPKGWASLVDNVLKEAKRIDPDLKVIQIKSKFGGLRLYVETENESVRSLIFKTEDYSFNVCVACAAREEKLRKGLCVECYEVEK